MSEAVNLNAYFERIGFSGSIAPTLATLEALHALHPAAIPFENLDSLLGVPVRLDQASMNQKLLFDRRGGYCFELNLMFLSVLRELGFDARGHLAKVLWGRTEDAGLTPDHMLLTVDVAGLTYIADVGFGGLLLAAPLKLRTGIEQPTTLETYRLTGEDPAFRLEVKRDEDKWWPAYEFSLAEVGEASYAQISDTLNADPDWFFRQHLLVERVQPGVRHLLFDTRLTTITPDAREVSTLGGVRPLRDALTDQFGIILPQAEGLDSALARIATRSSVGG